MVKTKYSNKPEKLQPELKELKKIHIGNKSLHEIQQKVSVDYTGGFKMVGKLSVGDQIRETHIRLRKITDCEACINAIDEGYDSRDAIFNGYFYKINTPQFNLVNRSQYGNGCDFNNEIIEYRGNVCFMPTKGYCFVKCVNFLTDEHYKQQYLDIIRNEKRQ